MEIRFQFAAALFLILASAPIAQALEECGDFLVVSYNQQKMIQSLSIDTGNPSTITLKSSKSEYYSYWFPKDHNESLSFDVIVYEPNGFLKQGEIFFIETGETKWYTKETGDRAYYNCSTAGKGLTDWFTFQFFKDKQIALSDGSEITANFSLVSSNNATNAFTFPDGTVGSDFLILTQNSIMQNSARYKSGTVFFKTQNGYTAVVTNGYARVKYVGCCATRIAPTVVPTPLPSPTPSPIPTPSLFANTPSPSPVVSQAASPTPSQQPQQQFDYSGIIFGAIILIALIALAAFAFKSAKKK